MKQDIFSKIAGDPTEKIISRETLNHRELIELVSGLDVYEHTQEAFFRAYEALGIDYVPRVPLENAPPPVPKGEVRRHPDSEKPYDFAPLGIYDTALRYKYACETVEDVWELDVDSLNYEDLIVPPPHPCTAEDIRLRDEAIGDIALYHPIFYTTFFMWAVEVLGWETFMLAAALGPQRFHDHFLVPCVQKSKAIVTEMAKVSESPYIFVHDDLASHTGPVFAPAWYDEFIFPHYPEIWGEAKALGKKIVFVADGNMASFFPKLLEVGVEGIFYENPATPLEAVIEHFGQDGHLFMGGIETAKLTFGTPDEVRKMVVDLVEKCGDFPGFVMHSCGGVHDGIPMENLEAYFDARAEVNVNPKDWRTRCRK